MTAPRLAPRISKAFATARGLAQARFIARVESEDPVWLIAHLRLATLHILEESPQAVQILARCVDRWSAEMTPGKADPELLTETEAELDRRILGDLLDYFLRAELIFGLPGARRRFLSWVRELLGSSLPDTALMGALEKERTQEEGSVGNLI